MTQTQAQQDETLKAALALIGRMCAAIEQAPSVGSERVPVFDKRWQEALMDNCTELRHVLGMKRFNSAETYASALLAHVKRGASAADTGTVAQRLEAVESAITDYNASAAPADKLLDPPADVVLEPIAPSLVQVAHQARDAAEYYRAALVRIAEHGADWKFLGTKAYEDVKAIARDALDPLANDRDHLDGGDTMSPTRR